MTSEMIKVQILTILAEHGVDLETVSEIDSIIYVTLIVEIEERFGIELPEDMLIINAFNDINWFVETISDLKTLEGMGINRKALLDN